MSVSNENVPFAAFAAFATFTTAIGAVRTRFTNTGRRVAPRSFVSACARARRETRSSVRSAPWLRDVTFRFTVNDAGSTSTSIRFNGVRHQYIRVSNEEHLPGCR